MRTTKLERTPTTSFPPGRRTWEWDETLGLGPAGSSLNLSKGWPGARQVCCAGLAAGRGGPGNDCRGWRASQVSWECPA